MPIYETWYGVRERGKPGTAMLYRTRAEANDHARKDNRYWWSRQGPVALVLFVFYGFRQKWYVVEEVRLMPTPAELANAEGD